MVISQSTEHRAQGTIEYLVIIAIVVIIGLVVVSMMVGLLDQGSSVSEKSSKLSNWSNAIAITETSVDPDGNYLVRLANNSGEELTVTNVKVGDTTANYSEDLMMSGAQNFVIDSNEACTLSEGTTKQVTITYVTKYGLTKTETFPADTFFNCEEYNVSLLADQCTTYTTQLLDGTTVSGLAGYYAAFDLNVIDTDLNADNITSGVEIFGITGTASAGGAATLVWGDYNSTTDTWYNHIDNCSILGSVDGNDWRLPTYDELDAVKATYIALDEYLWTSSTDPSDTSNAYALYSYFDYLNSDVKALDGGYGVRCVRST